MVINGNTLPDIPNSVDRNLYPYAIVMLNLDGEEDGNQYLLYCSSSPLIFNRNISDTYGFYWELPIERICLFVANANDSSWIFSEEMDFSGQSGNGITEYPSTGYIRSWIYWVDHNVVDLNTGEIMIRSMASSGLPKYSYNGFMLPEIQINSTEPYVYVIKVIENGETGYYRFDISSPCYVNTSGLICSETGSGIIYINAPETAGYDSDWYYTGSGPFEKDLLYMELNESTELIWSNVDVPYNSMNSTEIYFKGGSSNVKKFYYNGILLPELPQDTLTEYPYATLWNVSGIDYAVLLSQKPVFYTIIETGGKQCDVYGCEGITSAIGYMYDKSTDQLVISGTMDEVAVMPEIDGLNLIWSNHDIIDKTTNEIYFTASFPIPEDEFQPQNETLILIPKSELVQLADTIRIKSGKTEDMSIEEMNDAASRIKADSENSLDKFVLIKPIHDFPELLTEIFTIEKGE